MNELALACCMLRSGDADGNVDGNVDGKPCHRQPIYELSHMGTALYNYIFAAWHVLSYGLLYVALVSFRTISANYMVV